MVPTEPTVAPEWLARRLPWALAAVAASVVFMAWWLHWFGLVDLEVYRAGATAFLHGRDIYLAHPRVVPLPFTYPPFAAVFFVPLGLLPDVLSRVVMSLVSGAALVLASLAALRLAAPAWPARARWAIALGIAAATPLLEPVRDTFRLGQVNLVLMALVLADLAAILGADRTPVPAPPASDRPQLGRPDVPRASSGLGGASPRKRDLAQTLGGRLPAGVLLGLATAVKLTPGIFILYLLVLRRTREALTAIVTAVAATGLAALLMPSASARYWRHLVFDDRRIGPAGSVWNQSIRGALARLTGSPDGAHLLWLVLAVAVAVIGMAAAARLHRAGEALLGVGLAAVTGLLVSPISWNHHWVWFIPLAIALVRRAVVTGRRLDCWLAAVWVATFTVASMSWWPFAHQDDYRLGPGYTVAADCYVLAALVVVGLVAWRAFVTQPVPSARR
jgi:alpha-1,2-mannosyltransferase